jgi:Tol biopolymer transport system component
VLFTSYASNLVTGDSNGQGDVFLRDRELGTTKRVSVSTVDEEGTGASFGADMTPNGRFIVFTSDSSNLVPGDSNGLRDAFVLDRESVIIERISARKPGGSADIPVGGASISDDGRFLTFNAEDPGAFGPYAFLRDRELQTTTRIGLGEGGIDPNGGSRAIRVSGDGGVVVFSSDATNLVRGLLAPCEFPFCTSHLYAYDRRTGNVEALSVTPDGRPGNRGAGSASVSANGLTVAFDSDSSDLVSDDTNTTGDAFVRQFTFTATSASPTSPTGLPSTGGYNSEGQAETIRWLSAGAGLVLAAACAAWGTRRILRRFNY